MSASDFNLSGEEEVIAKPKGREYTVAEEEIAASEMTFYGSSSWCKLVKEWQEQHPIQKKTYSVEELEESSRVIKEANELWRKMKADKEQVRQEALERIGRDK